MSATGHEHPVYVLAEEHSTSQDWLSVAEAATELGLGEFQRLAFPTRPPGLVAARWRWMFEASARRLGAAPLFWLYRDRGAIVAQTGSIPVRLKVGEQCLSTGWLVETMVLDSHRAQAAGPRLMVRAHEEQPFSLSLGQSAEMRQYPAAPRVEAGGTASDCAGS